MKKIILSLVLLLSVICLVSCTGESGVKVSGLEVSGQKTEFVVGEEFETGEIKVVAMLSDNTSLDVTKDAKVTEPASLSSVGTYAVIVTYKEYSTSYQINVAPVAAEANLIVDAAEAKTSYVIGEEVSAEGAKVYHVSGAQLEEVAISECQVKVVDAQGNEVSGAIKVSGVYNVVVSYAELSASYSVAVAIHSYENVADAIAAGVANAGNVNSGVAVMTNYGSSTKYIYEIGNGYLKSASGSDEYGYDVYHYELQEDGTVFGVNEYENWDGAMTIGPAYDVTENHVLGADFSSLLSYSVPMFGLEAVVSGLYEQGASETSTNFESSVEVCPSCGAHVAYTFSYEFVQENFYYYFVSVSFGLSESESISSVEVTMDAYYSEEKVVVDESGNVIGVQPDVEYPDFSRVLEGSQNDGERTATNPYPAESLVFSSFDIVDENNNDVNGTTVNATMGGSVYLSVVNAAPSTASGAIDEVVITVLDADGFETYSVYGSYDSGMISLSAYQPGTYTVNVTTAKVEKSFTLVVEAAAVEYFAPAVYDASWWEFVEKSEVSVYANVLVEFNAYVNDGADASYTAQFKEAYENATLNEGWEAHEFTASAPGTYVVVLTSTVNPAFSAELTIVVSEAPSVAELLTGTYAFDSGMFGKFVYVFSTDFEGAASGTCSITAPGNEMFGAPAVDVVVKYSYEDGWLTVTDVNGMMPQASFTFDASYNLVCVYNGYEQGILEREGASSSELEGTYVYSFNHPMTGMLVEEMIIFNADGTGFYDLCGSMFVGTFSFTAEDGIIVFSNIESLMGELPVLLANYEGNVVTLTYSNADFGIEATYDFVK